MILIVCIVILAVATVVLAFALWHQVKATRAEVAERKDLLEHYQRRVDEQERVLSDYRELEKNFDSVGKGYEQALELFDKMEESSRKLEETNKVLEKRNQELQADQTRNSESSRRKSELISQTLGEVQRQLSAIDGAKAVLALVNKVADVSDMDTQQPIERTDVVTPAVVAAEAVAETGIDKVQYLTFNVQMGEGVETLQLRTNKRRAAHALALLLDNAMKFTTQGRVTLRVDADTVGGAVSYTVEDTGMGIPAEEAERVFEPFVQLNNYFDGTGVGLTVARNLARRLRGDVQLDKTYTEGARFILTLS